MQKKVSDARSVRPNGVIVDSFKRRVVNPGVISVVLVGSALVAWGAVGVLTGWKVYLCIIENSL